MKKPAMKWLRAIALSSVLGLAMPGQVQAAPVIGAVAAFAATPMGGILLNIGASVVTSFGASLLDQLTGRANKPKANLAMRLSVATGGVVPQSFLIGDWATAGSLNYRGSWGEANGTPNAFYVEEIILSDMPMPELTGFWYGEQRGTILFAEPHAQYGWPIQQARRNGKDHMWVKYRAGDQTTADPYLRAKFGTHPKRPYLATMIGRGRTVAIVTRRVPGEDDRDLFPANLGYKFETSGIPLYDISKDSTVGGSGTHRWDNPATWEPSGNTAVQVYNLWRGVRYRPNDEWIFGLQRLHPSQLPASVWIAAINEANVNKARKGKSAEPQFRTGAEITVDQELVAVTEQLLGGASGRMAEIGGIYKILLGAPGAAVYTHTDRNIVVTTEQGFEPFPRIEQTKNGVRPKFVSIDKGWELSDAPARYSAAFEAADGGRRLPADVTFSTVTSPTRVQRLTKAIAEEQRRWRKHRYGLSPEASELEPLDVLSWTSATNGYVAKKFLITEVDDEPTYLPIVYTQELDPSDYDFDANAEEQRVSEGFLDIQRPPAQVATAWNVEGINVIAQDGTTRGPGVRFTWNGLVEDVRAVQFEARIRTGPAVGTKVLTETTEFVSDGAIDYAGGRLIGGLLCEGRLKYVPRSKRRSVWTGWLDFDIPLGGLIGPEDLTPELRDTLEGVQEFLDEEMPAIVDELADIATDLDVLAGAPVFVYGNDYAIGTLVRYLDGIYQATAPNSNELPTNTAFWKKVGDYSSVAGTVIGFTGRISKVETDLTSTNDRVIQTTRDTRRITNALMAAAMLKSEQGAGQVIDNADQLAATATVSDTVRTEVSRIDGTTTALGEQINVVQAQVANDVAEAISAVTTKVQNVDGRVTAEAARVEALRAVVGDSASEVLMKGEVMNGPGGPNSRWALRLQTTNNGTVVAIGMLYIDIIDGVATIGLQANRSVFYTSDGTPFALLTDDKKFRSANGAFIVDMVTGNLESSGNFSFG